LGMFYVEPQVPTTVEGTISEAMQDYKWEDDKRPQIKLCTLTLKFPTFIDRLPQISGTKVTVTTDAIEDEYVFTSWAVEGIAAEDTEQTETTITFTMPDQDVTVTANYYKRAEYVITYDANGGTGGPVIQRKLEGIDIELTKSIPSRKDFECIGWSTSNTATVAEFTPGATFTVNDNVTLYAVWKSTVPMLAEGETWFTNNNTAGIEKSSITSIALVDSYETPATYEATWDASAGNAGTVTVWVESNGNGTNRLTLAGNGTGNIIANANSTKAFKDFTNVTAITGLSLLDTSSTTSMSNLFYGCGKLESVDVSGFNTSNVVYMNNMFYGCSSLTSINISNFDTRNVTYMSYMFQDCTNLTDLNLTGLNTSSVQFMQCMFMNCSSLESLDLSGFNTSSLTNTHSMFYDCSSLTSVNLSSFTTGNVTHMYQMFRNCSNLESLVLSNFDTTNVQNMKYMFYGCSKLNSLDLSNFVTSNVTQMNYMFSFCSSLTSLNISNFNTSNVTTMHSMFYDCSSLTELNVSHFNTSNVTEMTTMFGLCGGLTSLNVTNFNTSKVTDMAYMFANCTGLTSLDLSSFNTSAIKSNGVRLADDGHEIYYGLARFARGCTSLTEIILGDNFGQEGYIPAPGYDLGMFYVEPGVVTTVTGANQVMQNYVWTTDNRTLI